MCESPKTIYSQSSQKLASLEQNISLSADYFQSLSIKHPSRPVHADVAVIAEVGPYALLKKHNIFEDFSKSKL